MRTKILLIIFIFIKSSVFSQESKLLDNLGINNTTYELNIIKNEAKKSFTVTILKTATLKETSNNLVYDIDESTFIKTIIGLLKSNSLEGKNFTPNEDLKTKMASIYSKLNYELLGNKKNFLGIKKTTKPKVYNFNNTDPIVVNQKTAGITNTYEIRYNFKTKVYDRNLLGPKINHPVVFKIDHINRIAYDIKITSRDSTLTKGMDDSSPTSNGNTKEPKKLETLEVTPVNTETLNFENVKMESKDKTKFEDLKVKYERYKLRVRTLNEKINNNLLEINNTSKEVEKLLNIESSNDSTLLGNVLVTQNKIERLKITNDSIRDKIKEAENDRVNIVKELSDKEKSILKFIKYNEDYSKLFQIYNALNERVVEVNEIFKANNILVSIARNPQIYSTDDFNAIAKDSLGEYTDIDKINLKKKIISDYNRELSNFKSLHASLKNNYEILDVLKNTETFKDIIKNIDALDATVTKNNDKIVTQNPNQVIINMITLIQYLKNPETYRITSAPIQPTQDVVIFDVDIKTKKGLDYNNERKFSHKEYTKGGVRYDFSTGLVLGFGVNDYTFKKENIPNSTNERIIEKENNNEYLPSIGAMLHVSLRSHRLVSFGLTVGASISTTELDLNSLYPGLSILIGKTEKIIITVGPALKKIQYLKSEFEVNTPYPVGTLPDSFETESTFRQGWFVGLTYNLTNKQKSNYTIVK